MSKHTLKPLQVGALYRIKKAVNRFKQLTSGAANNKFFINDWVADKNGKIVSMRCERQMEPGEHVMLVGYEINAHPTSIPDGPEHGLGYKVDILYQDHIYYNNWLFEFEWLERFEEVDNE